MPARTSALLNKATALGAGLFFCAISADGRAQTPQRPRVSIEITGCESGFSALIRRLAVIELRALLMDAGAETAGTTRATVMCHGSTIDLAVADPLTGKTLQRSVSPPSTPSDARARLVALAVAELVTASWYELTMNPTPAVPTTDPPAPEEDTNAARSVILERSPEKKKWKLPFRLGLSLEGQLSFTGVRRTFGGGIRFELPIGATAFTAIDALYNRGGTDHPDGKVALDMWNLAATAGLGHSMGPVVARVSVGARGGLLQMRGESSQATVRGESFSGAWLGPIVRADVLFAQLALPFWVGIENGYTVIGLRGLSSEGTTTAVKGTWLSAHVGVLLTP